MFAFLILGICSVVTGAEKAESMREDGEFIPTYRPKTFDVDDPVSNGHFAPEHTLKAMVSTWRQKAGVMMSTGAEAEAEAQAEEQLDEQAPGVPHVGALAVTPGHPGYNENRFPARGPCPTGNFKVWALRKGCPCGGAIVPPGGSSRPDIYRPAWHSRTPAEHQARLDKVRRRSGGDPSRLMMADGSGFWNGDPGASTNSPHPAADDFGAPSEGPTALNCPTHVCRPQNECPTPLNGYDPCLNVAEGGACSLCQAGDASCFDHTDATYSGSYGASGPGYASTCVRQWAVIPNNTFGGKPSYFHAAAPEALTCMLTPNVAAQPAFFHDPCKYYSGAQAGAWRDFNAPCTICHPSDTNCQEPSPNVAKSCQLHGWNGALACRKVACDLCTADIELNLGFPNAFEFTRVADYPNYPGYHGIEHRFSPSAKTKATAWQNAMLAGGNVGNLALQTWLQETTGLHLNSGACTQKANVPGNCSVANPTVMHTCQGDTNCKWTSAINIGVCMYQGTQCSHCSQESIWTAHDRIPPNVSRVYCGYGTADFYRTRIGAHYYEGAGIHEMGDGSAGTNPAHHPPPAVPNPTNGVR